MFATRLRITTYAYPVVLAWLAWRGVRDRDRVVLAELALSLGAGAVFVVFLEEPFATARVRHVVYLVVVCSVLAALQAVLAGVAVRLFARERRLCWIVMMTWSLVLSSWHVFMTTDYLRELVRFGAIAR